MTVQYPFALLMMTALVIIVWAHLRGRATEASALSAFFLLREVDDETQQGGRRLNAWPLFIARSAALLILVLTIAGASLDTSEGTLVLAGGPDDVSAEWAQPITIIRAGYPPEQHAELQTLSHVDAPPNWSAALALGRSIAPEARVIRVPGRSAIRAPVTAGAALAGSEVAVSVTSDTEPRVTVDGTALELTNRGGEWSFRGRLKAGGADVTVADETVTGFCVPDARPLTVSRRGWPQRVIDVLSVIPHVNLVADDAHADWRLGSADTSDLWAPFRTSVTLFEWKGDADRGVAPVWFEGDLPIPDAVLRRWQALSPARTPVLWADGLVVADVAEGADGRVRRFGFLPTDTDLPLTAAWPALFFDAVEQDRAERSRCREVQAGETVVLASDEPVGVEDPIGRRRTVEARGGRVAIDQLDAAGVYILRSGGRVAYVAVQPRPRAQPAALVEAPSGREIPPNRTVWAFAASALILMIIIIGQLWRSVSLWSALAVLLLTCLEPALLGVERGAVVLAVDVSSSMPMDETRAMVDGLERNLAGEIEARVEGADEARAIKEAGAPLGSFEGTTRFGPLLSTAAEVAGPDGVLVLLSDGWPQDGVVSLNIPVFAMPVRADRVDAAITGARAVRLGKKTFVRVKLRSDRPCSGILKIGALETPVELTGTGEQTIQAVLTAVRSDTLQSHLIVKGDRVPANNLRPIVVEGPSNSQAVVIGPVAAWAQSAGFDVRELSAAELGEFGAELSQARAVWIADQPGEVFEPRLIQRLARWVRSGGFLVLSGRAKAFGAGGWSGSQLESLSPLLSRPARPDNRRAGVALLIDRSGSISKDAGGIGLESISRLVGSISGGLAPEDELSVIAFGGDVQTLLPPTTIGDLRADSVPVPTIARGGTRLAPAMERAERLLRSTTVDEKIIVILSDGRFADAELVSSRLKVSPPPGVKVVSIIGGDDPQREPLASVATATGGSIRLIEGEALNVVMERVFSSLNGDILVPGGTVTAGQGWQSRIGQTAPPVSSRVRVRGRSGARVLAKVSGEPLLGEWRLGRGRVLALATDDWGLSAEQWSALMAPALLSRPGGPVVTVDGAQIVFQGDVSDPSPRSVVEFTLPDGSTQSARWTPTGPGRSKVSLPKGPSMVVNVSSATGAGSVDQRVVSNHDQELLSRPPSVATLTLQSELNGGRLLRSPEDVQAVLSSRGRRGRWHLVTFGAILACLLLLLESMCWAGWRRRPFGSDGAS